MRLVSWSWRGASRRVVQGVIRGGGSAGWRDPLSRRNRTGTVQQGSTWRIFVFVVASVENHKVLSFVLDEIEHLVRFGRQPLVNGGMKDFTAERSPGVIGPPTEGDEAVNQA